MYRFERELEALRKELAEAQSNSQRSSPIMGSETESELVSPLLGSKLLGGKGGAQAEVEGLSLTLEGNKKDR